MVDNHFETADSLCKGREPAVWKWLASHRCKHHLNDKNEIVNGTKIQIDSELESSTLFEVPKESNNNNNTTTKSSSPRNMPSIPLERPNNNTKAVNLRISENTDAAMNRSHDKLPSNGSNFNTLPLADASDSNDTAIGPLDAKTLPSKECQSILP